MCGIIGYIGNENASQILLDGLELLEYRGYDSAGIAMQQQPSGKVSVYKCEGRVSDLREKMGTKQNKSNCGIGHTRWATHGGVCDKNAHPHQCGKVTLVHNGIIENYKQLAESYGLDSKLQSETDSEVVAALLDQIYTGNPEETIRKIVRKLRGTYALVMLFDDQPGVIYSVRNVSPIVATLCQEGAMLASDLMALCRLNREYFVVPEYHILKMQADRIQLYDPNGKPVQPQYQQVDWEVDSAGKNGYPFYMEKEIMEQPEAITKTLENHIAAGLPDFSVEGVEDSVFLSCKRICIVACGTAMYAGMVAQALMKSILHINVEVEMASEFMYSDPVIDKDTLLIAVSQSGETIDTLEAVKYAKKQGATCLSIINVKGSSISRECDYTLYTNAGPEIAVASTKAYTTQLTVFYLLIAKMALLRGLMTKQEVESFIIELQSVPGVIEEVLKRKKDIHLLAKQVITASDLFMVGRGLDYVTLLEGSLKLKEVSYIHSEAYAAGELKHGPIALITEGTPVIAAVTQEKILSKELSNVKEVKSRGANVVVFAKQTTAEQLQEYNVILLPQMKDEFMVFPVAVALQLFAYYVSADKGFDVDKPRNLAKVVTVE